MSGQRSAQPPQAHWAKVLQLVDRLGSGSDLRKVVENSGWLLFEKAVRLVLGVLVGAWVARYLGPARFGELAYVLAYMGIFQAAGSLGLDGIVVRDISRDAGRAPQLLGTVFALKTVSGVMLLLLGIAGLYCIAGDWDQRTQLAWLSGGSIVFLAGNTPDLWFQSQSQSRRTVVAKVFSYLAVNALKVFLVLKGATLGAFAFVLTIEGLLAAVALFVVYRVSKGPRPWGFNGDEAIRLIREATPLLLSAISIAIFMRMDQMMIEWMLGEEDLGVYAAVLPIATVWQFVPLTLSVSLSPFIARRKAESEAAYWTSLTKVFHIFGLLGWVASIPTALLSPVLVHYLFGPRYSAGGVVLAVYAFTNVFINLGVAQGLWAINEQRSACFLQKTLVGVVVSIVGNLVLIPVMGLLGVAIVAVLAQATSAVLSNVFISPKVLRMQIAAMAPLTMR